MERRQPIVARLTRDGALVLATLLLVNAFAGRWPGHAGLRFHPLPWAMALLGVGNRGGWWFPTGWSMQESLGLGLMLHFLRVTHFGMNLQDVCHVCVNLVVFVHALQSLPGACSRDKCPCQWRIAIPASLMWVGN